MEPVRLERIELLDHGYLFEVEHWGSDERIIDAARMSTDGGFVSWEPYAGHPKGDAGLLRYLYEHKHATPFEMAGMVIEVQCPIFVLRQWHRHRTQSYNEMSARYTPLPDMNYMPSVERCIPVAGTKNKQARGATEKVPTHGEVLHWLEHLKYAYNVAENTYQLGLSIGIPKEIARLPVPVARYSRMRASANLRNWLAFMTLRSDPHAQEEIRVFSDALGQHLEAAFPRTMELFWEKLGR